MIRMEQPSFSFNSYDVGYPHYMMSKWIVGPEYMTPSQLVGEIAAANTQALTSDKTSLLNIVLNAHGYPGGLWVGGQPDPTGGSREKPKKKHVAMEKADLVAFGILKPFNVGTIWITSCQIAWGDVGKSFCQTLANVAGTRVIASDENQIVTAGQYLGLLAAYRWNIDDFEGTVYSFTPKGGMRVVVDPETDPQIMTVQRPRW